MDNSAITKFIVSRKCNLSPSQLSLLTDQRFLTHTNHLFFLKKNCNELIGLLVDALYNTIPTVDVCFQKVLVQLKRDIYNNRSTKYDINDTLIACNLSDLIENINELRAINEEIISIEKQIHLFYQEYLIQSKTVLKKLCTDENFLKSIQLSGNRLVKKIQQYQMAPTSQIGSKSNRQTEDTLIHYLYRMGLNPTPFALFSATQVHINQQHGCSKQDLSICLTSRTLIQWFANQCLTLPCLQNVLPLRLNTTIKHDAETLIFFVRANELNKNIFGGEKFIKIKNSELITKIMLIIEHKALCKQELLEQLNVDQESRPGIDNFIEKLVEVGLFERKLPIPDLTIRYAARIAEFLDQNSEPLVKSLAQVFYKINDIELQFSHASFMDRELLLANFKTYLKDMLNLLNLEDPGLDHMRNFLYEDKGVVKTDVDEQARKFEHCIAELGVLSKILPIFDDHLIERVSLYHLYKKEFPESGVTTDFLDFYKIFSKLSVQDLSHIMSGISIPNADAIQQLRTDWFAFLKNKLSDAKGGILSLTHAELDGFIQKIPIFCQDAKSIIFYLQKNCSAETVFFNGASMGYGAFFSRFCLIENSFNHMPITKALTQAMNEHHDLSQMVDLTSVLGINTNLHSDIFNQSIEYPGCVSVQSSKYFCLNKIKIKADDQHQKLVLIDAETNQEIFFRPLNFLLPTMGPCLYRFLYLFCPYLNYKTGFWHKYLEHFDEKNTIFLPQLRIGSLILDKKTWKFPADQLPKLTAIQSDVGLFYQQIVEWFRSWSLPDKLFFSQMKAKKSKHDWISTMKTHMHFSQKNKIRNSHFLDLNNPILLKFFSKTIEELVENNLILQECTYHLDYFESPDKYIEEHLLQYNCST